MLYTGCSGPVLDRGRLGLAILYRLPRFPGASVFKMTGELKHRMDLALSVGPYLI